MSRPFKQKLLFTLCGGLALFCLLLSRPWYPPTTIEFTDVPPDATVFVTLEDGRGEEVRHTFGPQSRGAPVEFLLSRVVSLEVDSPKLVTISLKWHGVSHPQLFAGYFAIEEVPSSRWQLAPLAGMLLFSLFWSGFFLLLSFEWAQLKNWPRRSLVGFGLITLCLCGLAVLVVPGFFGWDIVANYVSAARYESTPFVGRFYSYLLMAGYQLVPALWIVTAANVLVTLLSLYHIYAFAIRRKLERVFYAVLLLFFLYPTNFYFTFFPSRDLPAFWCFTMAVLKLYECWQEPRANWTSFGWVLFFATCAILLRQEALIVLVPVLVYHALRYERPRRLRMALLLAVPIGAWSLFSLTTEQSMMPEKFYQTTILVNPLSSIVAAKYPGGLPPEVDKALGNFFKNDYLVTHHSPYDIDPLHKGGIVHATATPENYQQFRSAALDIIGSNPGLFVRNRIGIMQTMLGFKAGDPMYTEDEYYRVSLDGVANMLDKLPGPAHQRFPWFEHVYFTIEGYVSSHDKIYFQSYLMPLILWVAWVVLFPTRSFRVLSLVVFARSLLVFATAPAAYYKYQFPVWIFVPFVLVYAIAERQATRAEKAPSRSS